MAPYPKRGEVIRINLNPIQGREQMGEARPCLVLIDILHRPKGRGFLTTPQPKKELVAEWG